MSLYRQPGRVATRTVALVAVGMLVVGLAIGFGVGRASKSEPSLRSQLSSLRGDLAPARDGLEIVQTEYAQAVRGGRVVAQAEYQGARADVQRARDAVSGRRADLQVLDAAGVAVLERRLAALAAGVERRVAVGQVVLMARAAQTALDRVAGATGR